MGTWACTGIPWVSVHIRSHSGLRWEPSGILVSRLLGFVPVECFRFVGIRSSGIVFQDSRVRSMPMYPRSGCGVCDLRGLVFCVIQKMFMRSCSLHSPPLYVDAMTVNLLKNTAPRNYVSTEMSYPSSFLKHPFPPATEKNHGF